MTDPPRAEEPKDAPKEYVVGIIQRFMRHVRAELADDTIEWYRYRLQKYVDHLIGHSLDGLTVDELRPHHVREWADSDSKLSSGSKRNYIRAVQRCFNWAAEDGLIPFSPIAAMKKPKAGKRETVVRPAEFQELLSFVPDPALADLLEVTFDCGCRPQESLKVTAAHVDLTNSRWVLQQSEGKPGDMRVVWETTYRRIPTSPSRLPASSGTASRASCSPSAAS